MASVGARAMRSFAATARTAARAGRSSGSEALGGAAKARSPWAPAAGSFGHQTRRPASFLSRLPGEVACVRSLLPLHSATASSRLVAQLSTTAGALLQDDEDGT